MTRREVWKYSNKLRRFVKLDGVPQTVERKIALIDAADGDLPGVGWHSYYIIGALEVNRYYINNKWTGSTLKASGDRISGRTASGWVIDDI